MSMLPRDQYELLDFGNHQKLERLAGLVVARDTPSAFGKRQDIGRWSNASLQYRERGRGGTWSGTPPHLWTLRCPDGPLRFELRTTPTGQVGIFPEQAPNWQWLMRQHGSLTGASGINLFAYTGGSTLAGAHAGLAMTHVDAAKSVVGWARQNAALSELDSAPIRWIVEDAVKFATREIKRGRRYDVLIADPPSFGRGPGGQTWKLERDLEKLLQLLAQLASDDLRCILISCHTPGFDCRRVSRLCQQTFGSLPGFDAGQQATRELFLETANGRRLASGVCFHWSHPSLQPPIQD